MCLLESEFRERARTNKTVAVTNLCHDRLGHGAPAGDIAEVLGNLVERLRRSVGEQQDGGLRHVNLLLARR
jgi:hypothetical protein